MPFVPGHSDDNFRWSSPLDLVPISPVVATFPFFLHELEAYYGPLSLYYHINFLVLNMVICCCFVVVHCNTIRLHRSSCSPNFYQILYITVKRKQGKKTKIVNLPPIIVHDISNASYAPKYHRWTIFPAYLLHQIVQLKLMLATVDLFAFFCLFRQHPSWRF